jgi:hypothetical protein
MRPFSQVEDRVIVILEVGWHPICRFLTVAGSDGDLKVWLLSQSPFTLLSRPHGAKSIQRRF